MDWSFSTGSSSRLILLAIAILILTVYFIIEPRIRMVKLLFLLIGLFGFGRELIVWKRLRNKSSEVKELD